MAQKSISQTARERLDKMGKEPNYKAPATPKKSQDAKAIKDKSDQKRALRNE